MAKTTTALGPLSKLLDGDTGQLLGIIDAEGRPFTPLPVLDFTAAQLSAMATAGTLTPLATYIPSDSATKDEWRAPDAYTLVPKQVSEVSPYVTRTTTGAAFVGACELAGWYCSVAGGNITVYDALSATGTPIVPTQALAVGPLPIFGPGTNGKLRMATGCWVVLTGSPTVRMLVAGG